jgi:DEAD/DEAH box helicase domain-containing protein
MPRATTPIDVDSFVETLRSDHRVVHVERIPPRAARSATPARPVPDALAHLVPPGGLWSHQVEAIDHVRSGRSVAIATGTASGKSLCFQLPIAEAVACGDRPATAMLLFPTKALAQDQLRSLGALDVPGLVAVTHDGDSSHEERSWAMRHANVLLSNPEMLHVSILPSHARWGTFLKRLRYVVIDELHILRGMFGSNVAHVIRRLRRLCHYYGSDPVFVFTSATIGEPAVMASELSGLDVAAVIDDGSPRGERLFVLWDPSAAREDDDPDEPRSFSSARDSAEVSAALVRAGLRTITFSRSRKGTEIIAADLQRRLPTRLAKAVRPYRGGYLTAERREIEADLFSGRLRGVVATSALELGIDVGGLDACVLDGFPGTIASMWQQAGRAGRSSQSSVAVLVAGDDQLDQWFVQHPTELFDRPPEPAVVNPANPHVLLPHLACAAFERPLTEDDEQWWPGLLEDGVRDLVLADRLRVRPDDTGVGPVAVWAGRDRPANGVGLRSAGGEEYRIATADGTLIGTVDGARALRQVHPGAVYLHQGNAYRVHELDLSERVAIVEPDPGDEYTQVRAVTDISITSVDETRPIGRAEVGLGAVVVETRIIGYRRFDLRTREQLGVHDLDLPPSRLDTRGFWYVIDDSNASLAGVGPAELPGALHAIEHAGIGILPLFTICDRWDVGGVSTPWLVETGAPTIVIHDAAPGGIGIAELGYAAADRHLNTTLEVIESCGCTTGCPSCVQSPKCGNGNDPLDKHAAIELLRAVLG